jgi:hypothetical protein
VVFVLLLGDVGALVDDEEEEAKGEKVAVEFDRSRFDM